MADEDRQNQNSSFGSSLTNSGMKRTVSSAEWSGALLGNGGSVNASEQSSSSGQNDTAAREETKSNDVNEVQMTDPDSEVPSTSNVQLESEMYDAETEQIDQLQQSGEVLSQAVLESMHNAVLSANRYSSIRMPDEDQFIFILDQAIKVVQTGLDVPGSEIAERLKFLVDKILIPYFYRSFADAEIHILSSDQYALPAAIKYMKLLKLRLSNNRENEAHLDYITILNSILAKHSRYRLNTHQNSECLLKWLGEELIDMVSYDAVQRIIVPQYSIENNFPKCYLLSFFYLSGCCRVFVDHVKAVMNEQTPFLTCHVFLEPFANCCDFIVPSIFNEICSDILVKIMQRIENISDEQMDYGKIKGEIEETHLWRMIAAAMELFGRNYECSPEDERDQSLKCMQELQIARLNYLKGILSHGVFNSRISALDVFINGLSRKYDAYSFSLQNSRTFEWFKTSNIFNILIRDNLHSSIYVERLERLLKELIAVNAFDKRIISALWEGQQEKLGIIQRNIIRILSKIVPHLQHQLIVDFFKMLENSWYDNESKNQKMAVLEMIRVMGIETADRIREEGPKIILNKSLQFLWQMINNYDNESEYSSSDERNAVTETAYILLDKAMDTVHGRETVIPLVCELALQTIALSEQLPATGCFSLVVICAISLFNRILDRFDELDDDISEATLSTFFSKIKSFTLTVDLARNLIQLIDYFDKSLMGSTERLNVSSDSSQVESQDNVVYQIRVHFTLLVQYLRFDDSIKNNEWSKMMESLWSTVIGVRTEGLKDICLDYFMRIIEMMTVTANPFIVQLFDNCMYIPPERLSLMGFNCFKAMMHRVNMEKESIVETPAGMRSLTVDIKGEDYLWRLITEGNDQVWEQAAEMYVRLYYNIGCMGEVELDISFVTAVVNKCMEKLDAEVSKEDADGGSGISRERRVGNVLMTLRRLLEQNEACLKVANRVRTPLAKSILGKPLCIQVRIRDEDLRRSSNSDEDNVIPVWVSDNLYFKELMEYLHPIYKHNVDGQVHIHNLFLFERLHDQENRRLTFEHWPRTLRELGFHLRAEVDLRSERDRLVCDESLTDDEERNEIEKQMGVALSINKKYVDFLLQLADEPIFTNICLQLLLSIPPSPSYKMEIEQILQSSSDLRNLLSHFTSSSTRVYALFILSHLLLPSSYFACAESIKHQRNFFFSQGIASCLQWLHNSPSICPPHNPPLLSAFWHLLFRLLSLFIPPLLHSTRRVQHQHPDPFIRSYIHNVKTIPPKQNSKFYAMSLYTIMHLIGNKLIEINFENDDRIEEFLRELQLDKDATGDLSDYVLKCAMCLGLHSRRSMPDWLTSVDQNIAITADFFDYSDSLCSDSFAVLCLLAVCNSKQALLMFEDTKFFDVVMAQFYDERQMVCDTCTTSLVNLMSVFSSVNLPVVLQFMDKLFAAIPEANELVCQQFWNTLQMMISHLRVNSIHSKQPLPVLNDLEKKLQDEIKWITDVKNVAQETQQSFASESTLYGHLNLCYSLVISSSTLLPADCLQLAALLIDYFIFPSSRTFQQFRKQKELEEIPRSLTTAEMQNSQSSSLAVSPIPRSASAYPISPRIIPVCLSDDCQRSAAQLLTALSIRSLDCFQFVCEQVKELFYEHDFVNRNVWNHQSEYRLRRGAKYVGLRNGGATCYMNSVLQILFTNMELRNAIISTVVPPAVVESGSSAPSADSSTSQAEPYSIRMLRAVQNCFAHMLGCEVKAYTPDDIWANIRINGASAMNVHEQQDALEFFNSIADAVDEGMKTINSEKLFENFFSGSFEDQKICKDCPHKYSNTQPFTSLSVDVKNGWSLERSLEEYVKGDVLENDNAYHCELCNKKVRCVKRLVFNKLPPYLLVQLKRFSWDWERDTPIKSNEYFEFPLDCIDLYPYTSEGIARIDEGLSLEEDKRQIYRLRGVIVHSGQATGGHYYSFIRSNDDNKWYKFDDSEVTPYFANEEDMRQKWFGSNTSEFDDVGKSKKMRWWCAYLLFYDRAPSHATSPSACAAASDISDSSRTHPASPLTRLHKDLSNLSLASKFRQLPPHLEQRVSEENTRILHERNEFSHIYFHFINYITTEAIKSNDEDMMLCAVKLFSHFLLQTGLHAASHLRTSHHWEEIMKKFMENDATRQWLVEKVLISDLTEFFLIHCPVKEVREFYGGILQLCLSEDAIVQFLLDVYNTSRSNGEEKALEVMFVLLKLRQHSQQVSRLPGYHLFQFDRLLRSNLHIMLLDLYRHSISSNQFSLRTSFCHSVNVFLLELLRHIDWKDHSLNQADEEMPKNPFMGEPCVHWSELASLSAASSDHGFKRLELFLFSQETKHIHVNGSIAFLLGSVLSNPAQAHHLIQNNTQSEMCQSDRLLCFYSFENRNNSSVIIDCLLYLIMHTNSFRTREWAMKSFFMLGKIEDTLVRYRLEHVISESNLQDVRGRSFSFTGLRSLLDLPTDKQNVLLRVLVIVLESWPESIALDVFHSNSALRSFATILLSTFLSRHSHTSPIGADKQAEGMNASEWTVPTNEDAPKRLQEFIAKLEEKEEDIPEASDQPLDLSVSSAATAISPAPEIAPFPDDDLSFNGSANANSANSPASSATNATPHFSAPSPTHCTRMASPTQSQSSSSAGEKRPCPVDFKEDNEMISQEKRKHSVILDPIAELRMDTNSTTATAASAPVPASLTSDQSIPMEGMEGVQESEQSNGPLPTPETAPNTEDEMQEILATSKPASDVQPKPSTPLPDYQPY